jgi:hypothetical protein
MIVLLSNISDLVTFIQSLFDLTILNKNHEFNLVQLSCEDQIFYR